MDCGDDVEDDECEARAEVCSGIFPEPKDNPSNSSEPLTEDFQACLIEYRPLQPPAQPFIPPLRKWTHTRARYCSLLAMEYQPVLIHRLSFSPGSGYEFFFSGKSGLCPSRLWKEDWVCGA